MDHIKGDNMSTISKEDAIKMTKEEKTKYCIWCWGRDYGDCSLCALEPKKIKQEIDK